ncbi:DUF799 domain-containing protein [Marinobacter koreensis]|uniref:DUF799 domain-containing protein n=1 Tax=Marinobacter koreensis TaxID=335974 RepID=A0ABW0RJ19_9GAMM|nr:GNA1162 family protein [Marinobacter koreensis]MCK7546687.1 DUF799 domain-containing protein [Marinobacter koreensis]
MKMLKLCLVFLLVALATGCATTGQSNRLDAFHNAAPRSILVVPPVNMSTDVQGTTSLLATLPYYLAEKGYYVFPVNTVKTLLEYEGYYEPAEIQAAPPEQLANLFKADAILYVTIHEWTSRYMLLTTTTEVDFEYRIVNADGAELWSDRERLTYTPDNNSSGNPLVDLISMAVTAAAERAAPNYLPLTRQANAAAFYGANGVPPGPYSPSYEQYYKRIKASQ